MTKAATFAESKHILLGMVECDPYLAEFWGKLNEEEKTECLNHLSGYLSASICKLVKDKE